MIGMRLDGRLGNQLFQYALAFSIAKKYHTFYIIDNDYKVDAVKKYFKTNKLLNNKISRGLFKKLIAPKLPFIHEKGEADINEILALINNHQFYKGYFQSELFFQNIADSIQQYFRLKPFYTKAFYKKYQYLFAQKKVLAIHYRLGDYLTWGTIEHGGADLTLPESYYRNALKQIKDLDTYTIVIVTDDTKSITGKLPEIENKIIVSDTEINDLQVLMNADIIIASNSSFCWWAAYLNPKKPVIFAPRYWLGFKVKKEMPANIIARKFTKVETY